MSGRTSKLLRRFTSSIAKARHYREVKREYLRLNRRQKFVFRRMLLREL